MVDAIFTTTVEENLLGHQKY